MKRKIFLEIIAIIVAAVVFLTSLSAIVVVLTHSSNSSVSAYAETDISAQADFNYWNANENNTTSISGYWCLGSELQYNVQWDTSNLTVSNYDPVTESIYFEMTCIVGQALCDTLYVVMLPDRQEIYGKSNSDPHIVHYLFPVTQLSSESILVIPFQSCNSALYDFITKFLIVAGRHYGSIGYNNGYNTGYSEGEASGYESGYNTGLTDGENRGYNNGYNVGFNAGEAAGYEDGYTTGETDGYNNGYEVGYEKGEEAHANDFTDGYNSGYSDGINKTLSNISLNPVTIFLDPVHEFMSVKLFGSVSLADAFNVVLFVAVALIFIKMFAGG